MIRNHSRAYWFGASDTHTIMGKWSSQTFAQWWCVKLGLYERNFTTEAMQAGTVYEHRILDALGIKKRDRQIKKRLLRLRVNLDGEDRTTIYEVKTCKDTGKPIKVSRAYWEQAQAEMYATGKRRLYIVYYPLLEEDYKNFFNGIDVERVRRIKVDYDAVWIEREYLPRLRYLAHCLRRKIIPTWEGFCESKYSVGCA